MYTNLSFYLMQEGANANGVQKNTGDSTNAVKQTENRQDNHYINYFGYGFFLQTLYLREYLKIIWKM